MQESNAREGKQSQQYIIGANFVFCSCDADKSNLILCPPLAYFFCHSSQSRDMVLLSGPCLELSWKLKVFCGGPGQQYGSTFELQILGLSWLTERGRRTMCLNACCCLSSRDKGCSCFLLKWPCLARESLPLGIPQWIPHWDSGLAGCNTKSSQLLLKTKVSDLRNLLRVWNVNLVRRG